MKSSANPNRGICRSPKPGRFRVQLRRGNDIKLYREVPSIVEARRIRDEWEAANGCVIHSDRNNTVFRSPRPSNVTGIVGVGPMYVYRENRTPREHEEMLGGRVIEGYRASWHESGKQKYGYFSFRMFGKDALRLAIECRSKNVSGRPAQDS